MSDNESNEGFSMPKHGEVCWTELATSNVDTCKSFYSDLFGWNYQGGTVPEMAYHEISLNGGEVFGGMYTLTAEMANTPPHWMPYVAVDDIDAALQKAEDLGGTIIMPGTDIPQTGRFGVIADPTGAVIAMITLNAS
ncbi:MAG: VOC family protein [Pyrinomonadaceae bacterium]